MLRLIGDAICLADKDNLERLRKAYPAMVLAHDESNWDKAPYFREINPWDNLDCLIRRMTKDHNIKETPSIGSFGYYINYGGSFVKSIVSIIKSARYHGNIKKAFPQMVAAWKEKDWSVAPKGFKFNAYNSDPI
jgi:hypothetical protein